MVFFRRYDDYNNFSVTENVAVKFIVDYDLEKNDDGDEIIVPKKLDFQFEVKDGAHFTMTNLFNGNKELSKCQCFMITPNLLTHSIPRFSSFRYGNITNFNFFLYILVPARPRISLRNEKIDIIYQELRNTFYGLKNYVIQNRRRSRNNSTMFATETARSMYVLIKPS